MKAVALVGLFFVAAGATAQLSQYGGGGLSRSPHGRWSVWSRGTPADDEQGDVATAWLSGPGIRRRLTAYERGVRVYWMADRSHVVLLDRTDHFAWIETYRLARADHVPARRMQNDIEIVMAERWPRLGTIENRFVVPGRNFEQRPCVLVEESGLPPGRREGSYLVRRMAFRLDVDGGHALPIGRCSGATLE